VRFPGGLENLDVGKDFIKLRNKEVFQEDFRFHCIHNGELTVPTGSNRISSCVDQLLFPSFWRYFLRSFVLPSSICMRGMSILLMNLDTTGWT